MRKAIYITEDMHREAKIEAAIRGVAVGPMVQEWMREKLDEAAWMRQRKSQDQDPERGVA